MSLPCGVRGGINKYKSKTKSLINKSWVRLDKENNISLHPLIREIVGNEIKPAINQLLAYLDGFVNVSYRIRDKSLFEIDGTKDYKKMSEQGRNNFIKSVYEQYLNDMVRIGMLYEHSFYFLDKKYIELEASAAEMYFCEKPEQSILLSNLVLDDMLKYLKEIRKKGTSDFYAFITLRNLWCPKAEEFLWEAEEGIYYGNELNEDHSNEPEKVQNIYEKMNRYLHEKYQ